MLQNTENIALRSSQVFYVFLLLVEITILEPKVHGNNFRAQYNTVI